MSASQASQAPFPETPIEDHGLIGDLRTTALVARDGTIDFFCAPEFDSPTVFASLLDPDGGCFRVHPDCDGLRTTQLYLPDTNVLLTRFMSEQGIGELTDYMPVDGVSDPQRLVRHLRVIRGSLTFDILCAPRFDYATSPHRLEAASPLWGVFRPERGPPLLLRSSLPLAPLGHDLSARPTLRAGESALLILEIAPDRLAPEEPLDEAHVTAVFDRTIDYWHRWIGRSAYQGRWRETVNRSALALKLLTSKRTGGIVAAPTFGLPEFPGGDRNWDYRYVWIRDASFTMYAFMRLGMIDEADGFISWIDARVGECPDNGDPLRVLYAIDGRTEMAERTLGMRGYMRSRPVRVGNDAAEQFQLDIYGELMDAVYLANKYGKPTSFEGWRQIGRTIEWLSQNWRREDNGIWEGRGERKAFLHSRLMCWVTVDRAIRLSQKRSLPAPLADWNAMRSEIYASIHSDYWDEGLNSFVQYPGAERPDGSMLLMPLVRFISPTDPRWRGTMKLIRDNLVEDALVFRRTERDRELDGLAGEEGAFIACCFWFVECLARMGEVAEARLYFEKLLGYANHLGLYAEELAFTGRQYGNFPQALSHLALVSAASYLDRALSGRSPMTWA